MERQNRNVLIIMIAAVIIVAVFASFGLPLFASPPPTITLPTPVPTQAQPTETFRQGGGVPVEVTTDTVQSVIAALDRLESYTRQVTTILEGTVATTEVNVDGGWTRTDMSVGGVAIHTIVGDGTVWRWYNSDPMVVSWRADAASADVEGQRIPTYEDVLDLDKSVITAAGYEEKNGSPCVYVEVYILELNQRERYWVSSENGLLAAAETETEGEVVWSMTAETPEAPVSPLAAGLFALPDGTVLHTIGKAAESGVAFIESASAQG